MNASDPQAQAGAATQQPMAADPNAAMTDPTMADPNAAMPESMDGEEPIDGENNGDTTEIDDLWGSLSTEDRAALLKYGKSMVDDNETVDDAEADAGMGDEGTGEMPAEDPMAQQPMAESFIFSKGQLKKLNEMRRLIK